MRGRHDDGPERIPERRLGVSGPGSVTCRASEHVANDDRLDPGFLKLVMEGADDGGGRAPAREEALKVLLERGYLRLSRVTGAQARGQGHLGRLDRCDGLFLGGPAGDSPGGIELAPCLPGLLASPAELHGGLPGRCAQALLLPTQFFVLAFQVRDLRFPGIGRLAVLCRGSLQRGDLFLLRGEAPCGCFEFLYGGEVAGGGKEEAIDGMQLFPEGFPFTVLAELGLQLGEAELLLLELLPGFPVQGPCLAVLGPRDPELIQSALAPRQLQEAAHEAGPGFRYEPVGLTLGKGKHAAQGLGHSGTLEKVVVLLRAEPPVVGHTGY